MRQKYCLADSSMVFASAESDGPVDSPGTWKTPKRRYQPPHSRAIPVPRTQHRKQDQSLPPLADFPAKLPAKTLSPCSSSDEEANASDHTSKDQSIASFQLESRRGCCKAKAHANKSVSLLYKSLSQLRSYPSRCILVRLMSIARQSRSFVESTRRHPSHIQQLLKQSKTLVDAGERKGRGA